MKPTLALTLSVIAGIAWTIDGGAQARQRESEPGPERQKLAYFIGTWKTEGEMKQSMFGPAGTLSGTARHEWILGEFFYLTHHEEQNPSGKHVSVEITGCSNSISSGIGTWRMGMRGMWVPISRAVITASTPGRVFAVAESMRRRRPCAIGLRTITACSRASR